MEEELGYDDFAGQDEFVVQDCGFRKSMAEWEVVVAPEEPTEVAVKIPVVLSCAADGCELRWTR